MPITKLDAPRFFKNNCKKVDSNTIGNPSPQKNSTVDTPKTFLKKHASFCISMDFDISWNCLELDEI